LAVKKKIQKCLTTYVYNKLRPLSQSNLMSNTHKNTYIQRCRQLPCLGWQHSQEYLHSEM